MGRFGKLIDDNPKLFKFRDYISTRENVLFSSSASLKLFDIVWDVKGRSGEKATDDDKSISSTDLIYLDYQHLEIPKRFDRRRWGK